jgi:Mn-dependent DtxR family transcriptional regulator
MSKNTNHQSKSQAEVWKEFDHNPLTHSGAHYLMTIHELLKENGYARLTDVASRMDISPGSCSTSLRVLKKKGLIAEDANKFLKLTDEGMRLVSAVERNDYLLEYLFHHILGVSQHQAEIDACKMEHLLSEESSRKLANFINAIRGNASLASSIHDTLNDPEPACHHDSRFCELCEARCFMEG